MDKSHFLSYFQIPKKTYVLHEKNVKGEEKLKLQKDVESWRRKKVSHTWHQSYDDESIPRDNPIKIILSSVERTQFVIKFVDGVLL